MGRGFGRPSQALISAVPLVLVLVLSVWHMPGGHSSSGTAAKALSLAPPPPPLLVNITPNNTTVDVGQNVSLHANASGGSGVPADWSYTWNNVPTGCTAATTVNFTCTTTTNGTWNVTVTVHDSATHQTTTSANATVTVNSDLTIVQFTSSVGSTVTSGYNFTLSVLVSNGTPPVTYSYTGLFSGCTGSTTASVSCTAGAPGNYTFNVVVTDSTGDQNRSTFKLSVTAAAISPPPPKSGTTTGPVGASTYEAMAAILVVGALIVAALLVKARRDERQTFVATPRSTASPGAAGTPSSPTGETPAGGSPPKIGGEGG